MKYAAVDIGTNSCRLLIAEVIESGLCIIAKKMETTRIGEGVSKTGLLNDEAIDRTVDCLKGFKEIIEKQGVTAFRVVATSAVREASNKDIFINTVKNKCDLIIEVINPEEEAKLSYLGVHKGLNFSKQPIVIDLGGGSTEFLIDNYVISLPLGAVRVTESNMSVLEIKNILVEVSHLKTKFPDNPAVFVGGTATSLVAIKEAMETYNPQIVHGYRLSREDIADLYNLLERMPLNIRKRLPGLQPERADIIPAGTMVVLLIMDVLNKNEIIISESDIMEGIIWSLLN